MKHLQQKKNSFISFYILCALSIFTVSCVDPALQALNGVWELTSITTESTTLEFPVSCMDMLGIIVDPDIDEDGEDEDILQRLYFRFSDGTLRSFDAIDHVDPGEEADEEAWPIEEYIAFDSATDIDYTQTGYNISLEGMADDGSDVNGSFTISDGVLTFTSDDGQMAFTAEEKDRSVLAGAVDVPEEELE